MFMWTSFIIKLLVKLHVTYTTKHKLITKHVVQLGTVCLIRVTTYNKQLTVEQ